jgi:hypothetical protein
MSTDTIKTALTYFTAYSLVIGGLVIIYLTRADPAATEIRLLMAGFVGASTTFLFSERVAASAISNQPTVTTTAGPPPRTTITPPSGNGEGIG